MVKQVQFRDGKIFQYKGKREVNAAWRVITPPVDDWDGSDLVGFSKSVELAKKQIDNIVNPYNKLPQWAGDKYRKACHIEIVEI